VAFDEFRELNAGGTRVTYKTNTQEGSSGSPCFDEDWQLVALHHSGDPRMKQAAEFNEGIPLAAIRARMAKEVSARLGWS
jgi:V8-like Glu-specific endopeptidase